MLCFDSSAVSLVEGDWCQYAVVIGPAGHSAYLNGTSLTLHYNAGTGPNSYGYFATVPTPKTLLFGYGSLGVSWEWWYSNGVVDDIVIYDYPLTAQEARDLSVEP